MTTIDEEFNALERELRVANERLNLERWRNDCLRRDLKSERAKLDASREGRRNAQAERDELRMTQGGMEFTAELARLEAERDELQEALDDARSEIALLQLEVYRGDAIC